MRGRIYGRYFIKHYFCVLLTKLIVNGVDQQKIISAFFFLFTIIIIIN